MTFDPRDNAITPLRLGLALLVVFSHSFVAGGFGFDPLYAVTSGTMQLGTVSVIAFFGLSGFLLAGTRARRSRRTFAWHRFLRIAPGLLVNLAVMAVIVVPLAGLMSGTPADPGHVIRWIQSILTADIVPPTVPGLYGAGVLPDVANASLWTLSIEIWCYVILWAAPARFVWVVLAVMGGIAMGFHLVDDTYVPAALPLAFAVGGLLALGGVPTLMHRTVATGALIVTLAAIGLGNLALVAPITVPYLALWLGIVLPVRWKRDLSYGVYIYAWPVQELLAMAGLAALGFISYLAAVVVVVVGVAWFSLRLVEEPALRLRNRSWRATVRPLSLGVGDPELVGQDDARTS